MLMALFLKKVPLEKLEAGGLKVSGDRAALLLLQDAIETPPANYPIVTP
jgi:alkyl sulfatase BDS1-like metallo-beta-lactamase superfamily hydrolase